MTVLQGKTVLLGVSGGIAAYKAAALCSKLVQAGAKVQVVMTESAAKFVQPLTFQTLSKQRVMVDIFDEKDAGVVAHIAYADSADLVVVAPATANIIGKYAHGIADDMLSTTLLAATSPVLLAPAMNVHMYEHPAVQDNMAVLRSRGVRFIEPGEGLLACGYTGKGRLAEPEDILKAIDRILNPYRPLAGKKVLVTAGATVERIDPVRYLTNDSSGKMGFALAEAARDMGAEVTLIAGKTAQPAPGGIQTVSVVSAENMLEAVLERLEQSDIVIKAAAVADYRPAEQAGQKIKKKEYTMTLTLVKNPDILSIVGERKTKQFVVGFAAETEKVEEHAREKLARKNCDLLVANDVTQEGAGFGTDTNIIRIYDKQGLVESLPLLSKKEAAERVLSVIVEKIGAAKAPEGEA